MLYQLSYLSKVLVISRVRTLPDSLSRVNLLLSSPVSSDRGVIGGVQRLQLVLAISEDPPRPGVEGRG